ncbi:unnamed protein product [Penicillium bialowiezense]
MAATQKLYPRGTVKRIVKAQSNRTVSKNADILIFLDYMLFMQEYVYRPIFDAPLSLSLSSRVWSRDHWLGGMVG